VTHLNSKGNSDSSGNLTANLLPHLLSKEQKALGRGFLREGGEGMRNAKPGPGREQSQAGGGPRCPSLLFPPQGSTQPCPRLPTPSGTVNKNKMSIS